MNPTFSNSRRLQVITPSKATYEDLTVYHSRDYIDTVLDTSPRENRASNASEFGLENVSANIIVTLLVSDESMLRTAHYSWACQTMFN